MAARKISFLYSSLLAIVLLVLPSISARAEEYASAKDARDAAVKAMKDFQKASADCRDVTNSKNNLTPSESLGIKIILERAKTLLEDCAVPDLFSETSVKDLSADTGATPAKSISDYSDYVMEFEAYSSSIESVVDDINESLPNLKELGRLIADRKSDLNDFESKISKFESAYAGYSSDSKSLINSSSYWASYQSFKTTLLAEKEIYEKALTALDVLNRLVDLEDTIEEIKTLFANKLSNADLVKAINEMIDIANPKNLPKATNSSVKSVTISCVKGKSVKKVTGKNPKCPSGYKKK